MKGLKLIFCTLINKKQFVNRIVMNAVIDLLSDCLTDDEIRKPFYDGINSTIETMLGHLLCPL